MKRLILICIFIISTSVCSFGQDSTNFQATTFGIKSDGIVNNTTAIQAAIDYIADKGGGNLSFFVGRYITGGLELKSNVTIELNEGAILVATPNVNDYPMVNGVRSFIAGNNISNAKIIGKGVIEADPSSYFELLDQLRSKGKLDQDYLDPVPSLIYLNGCKDVEISGIMLQKAFKNVLNFNNSSDISLSNLIIRDNKTPGSDAITLRNTTNISMSNLYVDTDGKALVKDNASKVASIKKAITPNGKSIL